MFSTHSILNLCYWDFFFGSKTLTFTFIHLAEHFFFQKRHMREWSQSKGLKADSDQRWIQTSQKKTIYLAMRIEWIAGIAIWNTLLLYWFIIYRHFTYGVEIPGKLVKKWEYWIGCQSTTRHHACIYLYLGAFESSRFTCCHVFQR